MKAKKIDLLIENICSISTSVMREELGLDSASVNAFRTEFWRRIQQEYKYLLRESS